MVTPSADTSVSNGVYVPGGITNGDVKPASTTPLADFLMQLEEYTPTVSRGLQCAYEKLRLETGPSSDQRSEIGNTAYGLCYCCHSQAIS